MIRKQLQYIVKYEIFGVKVRRQRDLSNNNQYILFLFVKTHKLELKDDSFNIRVTLIKSNKY